jgi:hypothetical protein
MKNYQKLYYQRYYTMTPDGAETETTRRECFAPPEELPEYPFIQRWWYDPEAGYAIRLPRSPLGETLGKLNAANRKKDERAAISSAEHTAIELDKPIGYCDDGSVLYTELEDETADVCAIAEDNARLDALLAALDALSDDDRALWELMRTQARKQEVAKRFGITLDGVRYREKRLKAIIASDPILKSFYTDN